MNLTTANSRADMGAQQPFTAAAAEPTEALWWHAGWAGMVALETVALRFGAHAPATPILALLVGSLPALGALTLVSEPFRGAKLLQLSLWALAAVVAACLAGGVAGPLGVWCVMPLAAATVFGGGRRLAQGAALAVLALALTALAQAMGWSAQPPVGAIAYSLSLFGVAGVVFALGAGLMLERRRLSRRIEAEIETKDALGAMLEHQPQLILWLDETGKVRAAFGHAPPDVALARLKAEGLASLIAPARRPDLQFVLTEALERRAGALTFPLSGVEGVWLSLDVRDLAGSGLVAVLRDVTVEHEREADLERAKLDAESLHVGKSRFLANMSHELRTPLNAIMGFSDIMRARLFGTLPGKYVEYADLIHDAGSHLLDLINDVLDMSKIEAARYDLRIERLDAREPVSAALRLMRVQADDVGVQLRGVLPSQGMEVDADRRAIKQIALNLISNALKFTPRGGLVTVSLNSLAGALELSVSDTGVGIAESDLERLGRPYEQAGDMGQKAKGTGLGLSLVRAFAELHGGEMSIESRLGEGTAVTVRMPVLAPLAMRPQRELEMADGALLSPDPPVHGGAQVIPFKPQR
ncbi:MAG: HAMP domain-containing sensor histidine kinase [Caulobacteraceae bacterium]|nr:HAMP domain-containing sensor histidine kinase [Caulobacteraceae bacterium]